MNTSSWCVTFRIFMLTSCACFSIGHAQAQTELENLYVDDPRPVEEAVLSLISRYPLVITYEDPRYEDAGDMQDVTAELRSRNPNAKTTIVPRGGPLQASYDVSSDTKQPVDVSQMLERILEAKNLNPVGGHFALRQSDDAFHIVPTEIRDSTGQWIEQTSILDTPITLSTGETDGVELIRSILRKVAEARGLTRLLGPGLRGNLSTLVESYRGSVDAHDELASDVLSRLFRSINERLTWVINYDPTSDWYFFDVMMVAPPPRPAIPLDLSKLPRPGGPAPFESPKQSLKPPAQ